MIAPATHFFQINKKTILSLLFLWLLSTLIRMYAVRNYNFPYWFDLGRDAILSREIIENHDLKIQGPSASGTNDTIFHGVLYYYLIGPLYTVFNGDPQYVLYSMIGFSSLSVIPIYLLTKVITKKEPTAFLAGSLSIFSYEFFKGASWLSNPITSVVSIPFFFYFLWLVFVEKKRSLLPWLLLSLALTQQAAILFAPWWLFIFAGFLYEFHQGLLKKWSLRTILISFFFYLTGVSTMLINQLQLLKVGIFTLNSVSNFSSIEYVSPKGSVNIVVDQFFSKILDGIFPSIPVLSIITLIVLAVYAYNHFSKKVNIFLLSYFLSPLVLLSWHYRNAYHSLLTTEVVFFILLASMFSMLWKYKAGKIIVAICTILFIISNISAYKTASQQRLSEYFVPQGAYLNQMLQIIDYTYQNAQNREFSISTMTNPYRYNTLWAYLYYWYGKEKYGYLPYWYGNDQTGIFGGNILSKTEKAKPYHFSIREPHEGIPTWLYEEFEGEQNSAASPTATIFFGTIEIKEHYAK